MSNFDLVLVRPKVSKPIAVSLHLRRRKCWQSSLKVVTFLLLPALLLAQVPTWTPEQTSNSVVQVAVIVPNPGAPPSVNTKGTGFFLREDGLIATAAHVYLAAMTNINDTRAGVLVARRFSRTQRNTWIATPLDLLSVDYAHDVALLRLHAADPQWQAVGGIVPLQRETGTQPADDARVAVRGYFGADNFPIFLEGRVSGTTEIGALATQELLIVLPAAPGQSGSPLMSMETGRVVGVLTAIVPVSLPFNQQPAHSGLARAIEIEHINRLIDSLAQ